MTSNPYFQGLIPEATESDLDLGDLITATKGTTIPVSNDADWTSVPLRDEAGMARFQIHSARLMRISERSGLRKKDKAPYHTITGMFSGVSGAVEYKFTGSDEWETYDEIFRQQLSEAIGRELSPEDASTAQDNWRCRLGDNGVMAWMHFRADDQAREDLFNYVLSLPSGESDSTGPSTNTIERAARVFEEDDMPQVTSFEARSMDRLQTATGTGFLSIPDALLENMARIITERLAAVPSSREVKALTKQLEKLKIQLPKATDRTALNEQIGETETDIETATDVRDTFLNRSRSWANCWTGATQRMETVEEDGVVVEMVEDSEDIVDAQSMPCPTFTVKTGVNDEGELVTRTFSFWTDSDTVTSSDTDLSSLGTSDDEEDEVDFGEMIE